MAKAKDMIQSYIAGNRYYVWECDKRGREKERKTIKTIRELGRLKK